MRSKDLKIGSFYWVEIYEFGYEKSKKIAKIIAIKKLDSSTFYQVLVLNPVTGRLYFIDYEKLHFIKRASTNQVKLRVKEFIKGLQNFIKQ